MSYYAMKTYGGVEVYLHAFLTVVSFTLLPDKHILSGTRRTKAPVRCSSFFVCGYTRPGSLRVKKHLSAG
jgi:hypothetical protein